MADFYVNTTASGLNNGLSWNDAWESVDDINWGGISTNDNIYFSGGEEGSSKFYYNLIIPISDVNIKSSLDAGHSGQVIFNGNNILNDYCIYGDSISNVTVSGVYIKEAAISEVFFVDSTNINFLNCKLTSYSEGLCLQNVDNFLISGCYFDASSSMSAIKYGISVSSGSGIIKDNYLNFSYSNIYGGVPTTKITTLSYNIYTVDTTDIMIYNNSFINELSGRELSFCLYSKNNSNDLYIYNNTFNVNIEPNVLVYIEDNLDIINLGFYNNTLYGSAPYKMFYLLGMSNPQIYNNIFYTESDNILLHLFNPNLNPSNINNNLYYSKGTNIISKNGVNTSFVSWSGLGYDVNGLNTDPKLINPILNDLRLKSISPAIEAGTSLVSGLFDYDKDYIIRPLDSYWDIGAYEGTGEDIVPPVLVSGYIYDAYTIKLNFNESLEISTATDLTNYRISNIDNITDVIYLYNIEYNSINYTVTLHTSRHLSSNYLLKINGIEDTNGNTIDEIEMYYNYTDIDLIKPKILSAALTDKNNLVINFDEGVYPISGINYIISGITVNSVFYSSDNTTAYINTSDHTYNTYEVICQNLIDSNSNEIDSRFNSLKYSYILDDSINYNSVSPLIIHHKPDSKDLQLENMAMTINWCSRAILETFRNTDNFYYYGDQLITDEYYRLTTLSNIPNTSYLMYSKVFEFAENNYPSSRFNFQINETRVGNSNIKIEVCTNPGHINESWFIFYDTSILGSTNLQMFPNGHLDYSALELLSGEVDIQNNILHGTNKIQFRITITTDLIGNTAYINYYSLFTNPEL